MFKQTRFWGFWTVIFAIVLATEYLLGFLHTSIGEEINRLSPCMPVYRPLDSLPCWFGYDVLVVLLFGGLGLIFLGVYIFLKIRNRRLQ